MCRVPHFVRNRGAAQSGELIDQILVRFLLGSCQILVGFLVDCLEMVLEMVWIDSPVNPQKSVDEIGAAIVESWLYEFPFLSFLSIRRLSPPASAATAATAAV